MTLPTGWCGDGLELLVWLLTPWCTVYTPLRTRLMQLGVTHILNCARQVPNFHEDDFVYVRTSC